MLAGATLARPDAALEFAWANTTRARADGRVRIDLGGSSIRRNTRPSKMLSPKSASSRQVQEGEPLTISSLPPTSIQLPAQLDKSALGGEPEVVAPSAPLCHNRFC